MANIKFYKKGSYLIVEDSVTGLYHEEHANKVYVKKATAASTDYTIYIGEKTFRSQPIAEIQDESGVVYSQAEFEALYQGAADSSTVSGASSATIATQAVTETSTQILAAGDAEIGASFINLSNADAYILLGSGTASATNHTVALAHGGGDIYELPYNYSGAVQVVFAHSGSGDLVITKFN